MADNPTSPRDFLVAAGRDRLLTGGIDGLRALLNASVLSRDLPVSRDTAYRVFRDESAGGSVADAIVEAVADAVHEAAWAGHSVAMEGVLEAYMAGVNAGEEPLRILSTALERMFDAQFRSPGVAAAWLLQSAAFTSSPAWQGDPPDQASAALGRKILDLRRDFYDDLGDQLLEFFTAAMSAFGRRPRQGMDPPTIVALMHCLLDGLVMRRLIDPKAISPELAAEAIYLLGMALTGAGPPDDPRRPDDERNVDLYHRLVQSGHDLWQDRPDVTVDDVAIAAGVSAEAARLLFPQIGDLADSLLRTRVLFGGFVDLGSFPDPERAQQHLPSLVAELQRLQEFADTVPHAVAVAKAHRPSLSRPFVEDFVDCESGVIDVLGVTPQPMQLLRDLFEFASQGSSGWPSVVALLRTVGYGAT